MSRSIWPLVLAVALAPPGSPVAADEALDAAKADMAATLGPDSVQTGVFPDAFAASTWAQTRAWLIDNDATIPPKYRALIGLAVSSQIPANTASTLTPPTRGSSARPTRRSRRRSCSPG